ncbi:DUF1540 domain-containing protein [Longirhabdus pacifica]|uniref:DUF1540 domain-containing protein n=1 Tax=Longirhabdus pacifica TaxID=2305227 RepID=UPI001008A17C|nr:DUF1540 domain-containing protein [Longirhabdus pacifica]
MPSVKCAVSNCVYHQVGNLCGADTIMIDIDEHANASYDQEFAGENFSDNHKDTAKNESNTCCHTFKPKKTS